jgi:thiol:disulfide interchange protein
MRLRWFFILLLAAAGLRAQAQGSQASVSAALNVTALSPGQDAVVAVVLDIKDGFHAQSHTPRDPDLIALTIKPAKVEGVEWGEVVYAPGREEKYPALGTLSVYTGRTIFYVPLKVAADTKPGPLTLRGTIRYQICDDKACFAPQTQTWSVETRVAAGREAVSPKAPELFKGFDAAMRSPAAQPVIVVDSGKPAWGVAWALLIAFVAGIFFNIVPCVLPVLPIKVLGFAEVAQHHRGRTILLASVFGLGIVSVFAGLAVFILLLHKFTWGQQFSNPWFAWGVVALLVVMAAWMFGWLNFNLPGGVYSITPRHDTFIGNFEWGALTAVLSTPCTGPLFPPLMLWAQGQPVSIGLPAVMMVGVGMAFPYIALSAFPELARRFPRVGPWAELFKQMMGFMLLGAAVFFAAGRFLHGPALYWSLVPVAAVAAFYLVTRTIGHGAGARGVTIASVLAVLILGGTTYVAMTSVSPVNWQPYSDAAIDQARQKQIVLVKFTANWCLNCQYIERTVFHDKATAVALERYHVAAFKADLTDDDAPGWKRLKDLSPTGGIPLTAIYVPGSENPIIIDSVYTSSTLIQTLEQAARSEVGFNSRNALGL